MNSETVNQACHALSYVLNNWRKHKQDGRGLFDGRIDPFSSGVWFEGWKERTQPVAIPEDYEAPRVSAAQTWYLTVGYKLGPPISVYDVPGRKRSEPMFDENEVATPLEMLPWCDAGMFEA